MPETTERLQRAPGSSSIDQNLVRKAKRWLSFTKGRRDRLSSGECRIAGEGTSSEGLFPMQQTRRRFMAALPLAGVAGLFSWPHQADADAPPEVTSVRLPKSPSICAAPKYLMQELLHTEGFTEVQYVSGQTNVLKRGLADGTIDFDVDFAPRHVVNIDRGMAVTILVGVHVGCFDLIAAEHIRRVADLRGKRIGISALESSLAYVPRADHGECWYRSDQGFRLGC